MSNINESSSTSVCARFGQWQINFSDETLSEIVNGEEQPVELDNICRKALVYLIKNYDRVVTNDELLQKVWGVQGVTYDRISRAMSVIRTTLGDAATNPKYIKTVSRSGYQFIAEFETFELDVSKKFNADLKVRARVFSISIFVLLMIYLCGMAGYYYLSNMSKTLEVNNLSETIDFAHNFTISPKADAMAFVNYKENAINEVGGDLIVKRFDTKENTPVVRSEGISRIYSPTWHPINNTIAYKRVVEGVSCEIIVVHLNDELNQVIGQEDSVACSEQKLFVGFMDWSADGVHLLYSDLSKTSSNMAVFRVNIKTKVVDQITSPPSSSVGDYYGRVSKATNEFIFLRDVSQTVAQLWTLDLKNLEQKKLASFDEKTYPRFVDFTPDGSSYIYQNSVGVFMGIAKDGLREVSLYKPVDLQDSMKACPQGNLFTASVVPEQPLIVKVNNPFLSTTSKHRSLKVSEFFSLNPVSDKPDAYLNNTLAGTELWIDHKDGRKKMVHSFDHKHFNARLKFSNNGANIIVMIGGKVYVYSLEKQTMKLLNIEGQSLVKPSWAKNSSVVFAIDSSNWELMAIDVETAKQTKYKDGISFFKQSSDGVYEISVSYGSNVITLNDNKQVTITELTMPDFLNAKDLMVAFNNGFAYIKCAKCKLPNGESGQAIMQVDLENKTSKFKSLDILGDSREFIVSDDGSEFIIDSKTNKKTYKLQVMH